MQRGFTLLELIIAISVLLIVAMLAISAYNSIGSSDRIRETARIAKSAVMGARDRATHAGSRRGFRLICDPADSSLVTGIAYLQQIDNLEYSTGSIQLERRDEDPEDGFIDAAEVNIVNGSARPGPALDWFALKEFFAEPQRIRIPAKTGQWYGFLWSATGKYALTESRTYLQLTSPFIEQGNGADVIAHAYGSSAYTSAEIEMAPELLPFHAPIAFSKGVVIDLFYSDIPAAWYEQISVAKGSEVPPGWILEADDSATGANVILRRYSSKMDTMFLARGTVAGPIVASGPLFFLIRDAQAAMQNLEPADEREQGEQLVLAIFPQTGNAETHPVDLTDLRNNITGANGADGRADDLFHFARGGRRAGN